jgi:hypothetical protein
MSRISSVLAFSGLLAVAAAVSAQQPYGAVASDKGDRVTITGCVVRGDGGYLLTNIAQGPYDDKATHTSTFPPPTVAPAETPQLAQVLYWLKNDDKLEGHEGQRVQVEGKLEGELKKGEMEIERKGDRLEIEAKASGKKVKAVLPESAAPVATSGDMGKKKVEMNYLMRRFEVKSVKMITSTCQ